MQVSEAGLQMIKGSESLRTQVYDDRNGRTIYSYEEAIGYPTIGIGHLIRSDEREYFSQYLGGRGRMTEKQAWDLFREDIRKHTDPWTSRLTAPVTQQMLDAMISLAFNAGVNAKSLHRAIDAINLKDYQKAADEIRNGPTTSGGVTMPGLVRRRNEEADLFLSGGLPKIKVLPWLLVGSVALLGVSLYIRSRRK